MANIRSQIKRNRQNEARRRRNQAIRSELKTRTKGALSAAETGDSQAAETALRLAQKRLDTAASRGTIHARTAARRKSRLTKRVRARLG